MPASAEPIPREEILKGSEYQPDQYVLVSKEELRSITPKTSNDIQILEFVHLREIDPVYLETSYYAEPESAGEKPYALLYRALRQTGYVALAQIAMHRREHVAIIRPGERGILMHTMYTQTKCARIAKIAGRDVLVSGRRRARGDRASCQHYGRAEEKPGGCAQGSGPAPNLRTRARNRKSAMQKAGALKAQAETNRPVRAPAGANLEGLCYKSGHARIYAITP